MSETDFPTFRVKALSGASLSAIVGIGRGVNLAELHHECGDEPDSFLAIAKGETRGGKRFLCFPPLHFGRKKLRCTKGRIWGRCWPGRRPGPAL